MPTRPEVANGIATRSAARATATNAPTLTEPSGSRLRSSTTTAAISASAAAMAAVVPCPGSLIAIPQTTNRTESPVAGPAAEWRGRPASTMTAAPSSSDAAAISAPASRAESIRAG